MPKDPGPWTLEDVVDFEAGIASSPAATPELRAAVTAAAEGLDGAAARRAGWMAWLRARPSEGRGIRVSSAMALVSSLLAGVMVLAGIGAVLGMVDAAKAGVHVTLYLVILLGGQWLILAMAGLAWIFRRRGAAGFSLVQAGIGRMARSLAGASRDAWWDHLIAEGGPAREAVGWRIARIAQSAGVAFNLGALLGLGGLVLVRHVGFFWETTTELAMHSLLEQTCRFLSIPWASWWPDAVPDARVIAASRWLPEHDLPSGPAEWWRFLLAATFVWGLLPRLVLWQMAGMAERAALGRLDFQSRIHRSMWRDLTAAGRVDTDEPPLDGVLVLDVGGSGIPLETLRPFLLRSLRVHPTAWQPVAVLDPGAESEVALALAKAPAGVVLLSEGWSLSPARMTALHAKVRAAAGPHTPIHFLIANTDPQGLPQPPAPQEQREWERFIDSLRDPSAEIHPFTLLQTNN